MKEQREVIDLVRVPTRDGRDVWAPPQRQTRSEVVITDGVVGTEDEPLSTVPSDRMAQGPDWNRIMSSIQRQEAGQRSDDEVVVEPGGVLRPVSRGEADRGASVIPKDRMASDESLIRRLDPDDLERWRYIDDPVVSGWTFRLKPARQWYRFFTFKMTSLGGKWLVTPLTPEFGDLVGTHEGHIVTVRIGSETMPVICKKRNDWGHATLKEVRGTAAKFGLYHDLRLNGQAAFSA